MPFVGQTVQVFAQFQKAGVDTAPSPAPTVTVYPPGGPASTGNSATVVDAVNLPGWYSYSISNVVLGSYAIRFITSDTTTDKPNLGAAFIVDPTVASVTLAADQPVNVTKFGGTVQTARDLGANVDTTVSSRVTLGAGGVSVPVTITVGGNPLSGVDVWVTTDLIGAHTIAQGFTDTFGTVKFMLSAGTYYVWQLLAGYKFTNPQTLVV